MQSWDCCIAVPCAQHGPLWRAEFASRSKPSKCLSSVVFVCLLGFHNCSSLFHLDLLFGNWCGTTSSKTQKLVGMNFIALGAYYSMKYIHGFIDS